MKRVVIDTNVFVSAFIGHKPSAAKQVYQSVLKKQIIHVTSALILSEFEEVMKRPYIYKYHKLTSKEVRNVIIALSKISYVVPGKVTLSGITTDPDDVMFFEAALEGNAHYIVSGDPHLLVVKEYQAIKTVMAKDLIKIL